MVSHHFSADFCSIDFVIIALRIEWCKTRARAKRWAEEVELLQEEMRRVLAYFDWHARVWIERGNGWAEIDDEQREGLVAYAHRQAAIQQSLHDHAKHLWRYVPQYVALGVDTVEDEQYDSSTIEEVDE